ncbi:MAG: hypothetical protein JNL58_28230 [Planctomyces sp.]|nr:hypothetical protein [Planctomyces sp.]
MSISASSLRGMDLEYFSGTITIHSPIKVNGTACPTNYVIHFENGEASVLYRGKRSPIGVIQFGELMLYRMGERNEGLRFLLFPDIRYVSAELSYEEACQSRSHRSWGLHRCRFSRFEASLMKYEDSIRYTVSANDEMCANS